MALTKRPHRTVQRYSNGPKYQEAMNTAPGPYPQQSIAGYGKLNAAPQPTLPSGPGTASPRIKGQSPRMNAPSDSPTNRHTRKGGSSLSGGAITKPKRGTGGSNDPKHGSGPSGLGDYGSKYAPMG